jgi:hypothetical protein
MKRIVFALTAATVLLAALSSLSWGQAVDKPRRVGVLLNSTASDRWMDCMRMAGMTGAI